MVAVLVIVSMTAVGMLGECHTTKSHASPNCVGKLSGSQVYGELWQVYSNGQFMVAAEVEGCRAAGLPKNATLSESNYAH